MHPVVDAATIRLKAATTEQITGKVNNEREKPVGFVTHRRVIRLYNNVTHHIQQIVETNVEKSDLYSVTSQHCRLQCNEFLMDQAQKICKGDYTIQDRQVLAGGTTMLIRCTKK